MSFTETDFNGWRFDRDAVHFNGGSEFFGWGHRCVTQPRLLVIDKSFKRTRTTERSYLIDGRTQCTTLAEALAALSVPPVLSRDDRLMLHHLSSGEWMRPASRVPYMPFADMGLIEWGRDDEKRVTCRLTDAGRQTIAPEDAQ